MSRSNAAANESQYDVLVIGGGPAGIGAAVGAAQMGTRVALVERHPILGGMGTAALVNNFCAAHHDGQRLVIGGVFGKLRQRLIGRKAIYATTRMEPYNPEVFIEESAAMCREAGVRLYLGETISDVTFDAGRDVRVRLASGGKLCGKTLVDATGDALVAFRAGVPFTFGRASDHAVMPLTYCYMMGPIDLATAKRETPQFMHHDEAVGEDYYFLSGWYPDVDKKVAEARARGELRISRDHISAICSVPNMPQYATVNFGRVNVADPTDPVQLAAAEAEGKLQVQDGLRFFRKYLPGLENVDLVQLARQIGVRESRQIVGQYVLTGEDVVSGAQFEDVIAQSCYPVDIHEPGSDQTTMKPVGGVGHYDIPWRCLVPKSGPANLIVGGRSISATNEAMSSFRVSPSVMALGEAAGVTASLAALRGCGMADVGAPDVQKQLLATGGILK